MDPRSYCLFITVVIVCKGDFSPVEDPFLATEPDNPTTSGTKFLVGFMQNVLPRDAVRPVPDAYLLVTTNETAVVEFDVTTMFGGVQSSSTYTVDSSAPTRVNFAADDVYVTNIQERDKAIWVQTSNNKKIAIKVVNDEFRSSDGFVALPCDSMTVPSDFRIYEYLILSTNQDTTGQSGSTPRSSQFLVITCDDDTQVAVTPSTAISGSGAFQHTLFGPGESQASSNWRVNTNNNLIPAQQTLLISITNQDLTGTVVQGNKPLVVISGHQCGQVTESVTTCDHVAAQIPPHTTWGYTFLLNPLSGRRSGDLYRFATLQDDTDITITCVNAGSSTATVEYTTTLNSAQGSNWGQFETHSEGCSAPYVPKYCCLESSNPVILAQYSYGYTRDAACNGGELGDPFMSVIPPMAQYLRFYHLVPVSFSSGPIVNHFFSVSVPVRYFQPCRIMLDNAPLEANATLWQAIYCSTGEICGYGITKDFDNQYHILFHADANSAIFVHTYGFNTQNSYAIAGGMELQPISGTIISCTVPADCVVEGSSVTVTCTRSLDLTQQSRIQVNTADGFATAPADYTTLNIPENRPSFFAGNILNYRGGSRQDSVISFDIQTTADSDDTEPQETFFLNVSPVRTVIVLTSRVTITICGGIVSEVDCCLILNETENVAVEYSGLSPGTTATFTCPSGFELVGASTLMCGPSCQWSDLPPTCRPLCCMLTHPDNGMLTLTGTSIGDSANYSCDEGFNLVGPPALTCQSNGTWDNPAPICQSANVFVSFSPTLYTVTEGTNQFVELIVTRTGNLSVYTEFTVATYNGTAEAGLDYTMTEVEGVFDAEYTVAVVTVAILDDHVTEEAEIFIVVLSSSAPNVVIGSGNTSFIVIVDKNVVCPNLTEPGNGGVVLSGVSLGDTATFTCTNGYELVGDSVLYCLSGGTWDNSPPVCQGPTVFCPNLMDPANGEVILSGVSVGDTATFTCNAEFELRGDSVLTCLSDITWDKTPPVCQGPTVLFQPTTYTVTEGVDEVVELIVLAENIKTSTITVNVSFFPGSAQATQDFIASSKLIALAPGETEDRVKVPIIDDTIEEDAETFTAVLSVLEITVDVPAAVATVTIIDNDGNDSEKQSTGTIVTLSVIIPVIILASAIIISLLIVFFYQKKRRQHPNRPPVENIYVDPSTFCRQEPTSENPADNFPPKPLLQHSSQLLATEAKYSADTKV